MQDNYLKYEKNYLNKIVEAIKLFRLQKNFSQENLAEKVGCSREFINRLENKKEMPSLKMLIKLSYILEVRLEDILK